MLSVDTMHVENRFCTSEEDEIREAGRHCGHAHGSCLGWLFISFLVAADNLEQ